MISTKSLLFQVSEFLHLQCEIGAAEAEEIGAFKSVKCSSPLPLTHPPGVEHLLRDVKDLNITSLSQQVAEKILSLRALQLRLVEAHECAAKAFCGFV
jgi:hypothetical protein